MANQNFLDILDTSPVLPQGERRELGGLNRDVLGQRLDDKMRRVQERTEQLSHTESYSSLGGSKAVTDGDNIGDLRLQASDGSTYDAWETRKDPSFLQGKVFNKETGAYEFNADVAAQRQQKMSNQRQQLDNLNGWSVGTATDDDVYAKGDASKAALANLLGSYGEDYNIDFTDIDTKDKSAGSRTITRATLPDGRNIADVLNTPDLNASYASKYNRGQKDKDAQAIQKADLEANKDAIFDTDSFLGSLGNTAVAGVGGAQTAVGKALTAGPRAEAAILTDIQTQEAQALDASIASKAPADYTQQEKDYITGKYKTKEDKDTSKDDGFLTKIAKKLPTVAAFNAVRDANRTLARKDSFINPDQNKDTGQGKEFERGQRINQNKKFSKEVEGYASNISSKYVNNKNLKQYERQAKVSGGNFSEATRRIGKAIESGDATEALKGVGRGLQGVGQMAKDLYNSPGVAVQVTAQSVAEMVMLSKASGLASGFTVNEFVDKMDTAYKATHDGKSAKGADKLKQVAAASAIAIIQKGGTDYAVSPMAKIWNKIGIKKLDEPIKLGKGEYHRFYPAGLANVKNAPATSILKESYRKIDAMPDAVIAKTVGQKTMSALKATAKFTGVSVKEILKTSLGVGLSLGKNTGKLTGAALTEYGEEFGEELLSQAGSNVGTDKELDFGKAHSSGSLGFGSGGVMKVPTLTPVAVKEAGKALFRVKDKGATGDGEGVEITETIEAFVDRQTATPDLKTNVDNITDPKTRELVTEFGNQEDLEKLIVNAYAARTEYRNIANEEVLNATDADSSEVIKERIEARAGVGTDKISKFIRDIESDINERPTLEGKTTEEITDADLATDALEASTERGGVVSMLQGDKLDKVYEAIKNGTIDEKLGKKLLKLKEVNETSSEDVLRVSDEILVADGKGKTSKKKSVTAHMQDVSDALESGDIKEAKRSLATLESFTKTQNLKLKLFNEFLKNDAVDHMFWGKGASKRKYTKEGIQSLVGKVKVESSIMDINVEVAKFAIKSKKYSLKQNALIENLNKNGTANETDGILKENETGKVVTTSTSSTEQNPTNEEVPPSNSNVAPRYSQKQIESAKKNIATLKSNIARLEAIENPTPQNKLHLTKNRENLVKLTARVNNNEVTPEAESGTNSTPTNDSDSIKRFKLAVTNATTSHGRLLKSPLSTEEDIATSKARLDKAKADLKQAQLGKYTNPGNTGTDTKPNKPPENPKPTNEENNTGTGTKPKAIGQEVNPVVDESTHSDPTSENFKGVVSSSLHAIKEPKKALADKKLMNQKRAERKSFEAADPKNTNEAFEWAIKHSPDKLTTILLKGAYAFAKASGINYDVKLDIFPDDITPEGPHGQVDSTKKTLVFFVESNKKGLRDDVVPRFSYSTAIHELLHVGTSHFLFSGSNKAKVLGKELTGLLNEARKHPKALVKSSIKGSKETKFIYGLTNEHEFLAELSNPYFRAFLHDIVDPNSEGDTKQSLLESIKDLFKKAIIAMNFIPAQANGSNTLLDSSLNLYNKMLDNNFAIPLGIESKVEPKVDNNKRLNDLTSKINKLETVNVEDLTPIQSSNLAALIEQRRALRIELGINNEAESNNGYPPWLTSDGHVADIIPEGYLEYEASAQEREAEILANTTQELNIIPEGHDPEEVVVGKPKEVLESYFENKNEYSANGSGHLESYIKTGNNDGVLSTIKDAFLDIDSVHNLIVHLGLDEANTDGILKFFEFKEDFKKRLIAMDAGISERHKENPKYYTKDVLVDDPLLEFSKDGTYAGLPDNFITAMALTANRYVGEQLFETLHNDGDAILKILGVPSSTSFALEYMPLTSIGANRSIVVMNLAETFLKEININEKTDAPRGRYVPKIGAGAGNLILLTLEDMDLIEFKGIEGPLFHRLKQLSKRIKTKFKAGKSKLSYTAFVRVKTTNDWTLDDKFVAENKQFNKTGRKALNEVFGNIGSSVITPLYSPVKDSQLPKRLKNSFMNISRTMLTALRNAGRIPFFVNENRLEMFLALPDQIQKDILGWQDPKDHLDHFAEEITGKNLSIQRDLDNLRAFRQDRDGLLDKPLYFTYKVQRNVRMGTESNQISMQQSKLHRQMFYAKDWISTIDISNAKQLREFKESFELSMGVGAFNEMISVNGKKTKAKDEDVEAAINLIISGKKTDFTEDEGRAMHAAIEAFGEGMMGYMMLHMMADFVKAKREGKTKFTTTGYVETDGVTNGTITSQIQTLSSDITNPDENTGFIRRALNAGGVFFRGQRYKNIEEYYDRNPDNYKHLIIEYYDKFLQSGIENSHPEFLALRDLVMNEFIKDGEPTKAGRDFAKPFVMTFVYSKGAAAMHGDVMNELNTAVYQHINNYRGNKAKMLELENILNAMPREKEQRKWDLVKRAKNGSIQSIDFERDGYFLNASMDVSAAATISDIMVDSLNESYPSIVGGRTVINSAIGRAYHIGAKVYEYEVLLAEELKAAKLAGVEHHRGFTDTVPLTEGEKRALIDRLIEEGKLPTLKHVSSETFKDSLLVKEFDLVAIPKERGGRTYTKINKKSKINILTSTDGKTRTEEVQSASGLLYERTFGSDVGVKAFLNAILSFDANVQASLMGSSKIPSMFNIHDAQLWGMNVWKHGAKEANRIFLENHAKWSLPVEAANTMERMLLVQEEYLAKTGNRNMFHMERSEYRLFGLPSVVSDMRALKERSTTARKTFFGKNGVSLLEQFANMGNPFVNTAKVQKGNLASVEEATKDVEDYFTDGHGSSPDPFRLQGFAVQKIEVLNKSNLYSTFDGLGRLDRKTHAPISNAHKKSLSTFMGSTGVAVFNLVDKINLKRKENGSKNQGYTKDNNIFLGVASNVLRKLNSMSAQEAFAHEVSHIVIDEGIKNDKKFYSDLLALFQDVKASGITFEDFVTTDNPSDQDLQDAENLYNYIFNNKDITEFGAYGLTNEIVGNFLKSYKPRRISKVIGDNLTPFDYLQNIFSDMVHSMLSSPTAYQKLQALADRATQVHTEAKAKSEYTFNPFSEKMNKKAAELLADKVTEPLSTWFKDHPELYKGNINKVASVALSPIRLGLSLTSLALNAAAHPEIVQNIREMGNEIHRETRKFATSLINEVAVGADSRNVKFHDLLRHTKHFVEAAHVRIANGTRSQIKARFHEDNEPTKHEWTAMTDVLLRTDMGALIDQMSIEQIRQILDNDKSLDKEISRLEKLVTAGNPNGTMHLNYTKNLGKFMATGLTGMKDTKLNAYSIATSFDKENKYSQDTELDIDTLATLYAIKYTDKGSRKTVSDLFQREEDINSNNNGVLFILEMSNVTKQEALHGNFNGDDSNMIKGYVKEQYHNNFNFIHLVDDGTAGFKSKTLEPNIKDGYTIVSEEVNSDGKTVYTLVSRNVFTQKYQSGIANLTNISSKGSFIFEQKPENPSKLNSKGFKLDFTKKFGIPSAEVHGNEARYIMDKKSKEDFLRMETDASSVLSETLASVSTKKKSVKFNHKLVDLLKKDYKKYYKKGEKYTKDNFVKLNDPEGLYYEKYKMLPDAMKDYLDSKFGDDVMVNEDYMDLVFGFRKKSLTNLVSKGSDNKQLKAVTYHSEQIWQAVVSTAKLSVVVYTPMVLIANVVSNMVLSTVRGVPITYVLSKQGEALKAMHAYRKLIARRDILTRELQTTLVNNKVAKENSLARIKQAIKANPVHALVNDGLYSTIAEDIDADKAPLRKAVNSAVNSLSEEKTNLISNKMDEYSDRVPDFVSSAFKNLTIAPDTNLAKDLREATQISDFVARYAMHSYRTKVQGVPHKEAVKEVVDVFINYDWNSSAQMQWINDMGILMYTKFLFRIQKIIVQNFRDRPVNAISSEVAQRALYDIPDPVDSHLLGAIRPSRLGSPSDNLDQAFELNLLHYFSWLI